MLLNSTFTSDCECASLVVFSIYKSQFVGKYSTYQLECAQGQIGNHVLAIILTVVTHLKCYSRSLAVTHAEQVVLSQK